MSKSRAATEKEKQKDKEEKNSQSVSQNNLEFILDAKMMEFSFPALKKYPVMDKIIIQSSLTLYMGLLFQGDLFTNLTSSPVTPKRGRRKSDFTPGVREVSPAIDLVTSNCSNMRFFHRSACGKKPKTLASFCIEHGTNKVHANTNKTPIFFYTKIYKNVHDHTNLL